MNKFDWIDKNIFYLNDTFLVLFYLVWLFIRRYFSTVEYGRIQKNQFKKRHMGDKLFPRIINIETMGYYIFDHL